MTIQNVTIVGANGNLGSIVLKALLTADPPFQRVTILRRASSRLSEPLHPSIRVIEVLTWTASTLTEPLTGEDAVIACFPLADVNAHFALADAAADAGVKRFIPADYGSVDARSPRARALVSLFDNKVRVREHLEQLAAASSSGFTWTSLVNGHFFDWGLTNGFLHFYPETQTAEILGDGTQKSSLSTLHRVAQAVVSVLQRPDETANRVLMVQSFCVSQLDVLSALERATGTQWKAEFRDTDAFIAEKKTLADAGDKEAIEDLVFALGVIEGNWEEEEDFAMELLGLKEDENLDRVVAGALRR
ncbi:isoflavone reductase family protein [Podospora didyma]|uniref:Isoflavone reductase family protein n=1 Tax=Podospora didyma TaxID=330526 RepID=A0AAE0K1I0_9PEZI|nr:isoflavone reductase family protein [Podospora didyma]